MLKQRVELSAAEVATPGISSSPLSACLSKEMKRLQFPRHKDKKIEMRVPFNYRVP
jgi:hypothetical protein